MQPHQNTETPPESTDQQVPFNGVPQTPTNQALPIQLQAALQLHQGPIPSAQEIAAYEKVLPGSAGRIIQMAEREQKAAIRLRWADWASQFVSILLGKGFLWLLVVVTLILSLKDKPYIAFLTAIAPITSVVYSTFFGQNQKKKGKKNKK